MAISKTNVQIHQVWSNSWISHDYNELFSLIDRAVALKCYIFWNIRLFSFDDDDRMIVIISLKKKDSLMILWYIGLKNSRWYK